MGVALLVIAGDGFAWGSIGHRVVGQVAGKHLSAKAAARVSKILGTNSLGAAANWMDDMRGTPEGVKMDHWHYEKIDLCDSSLRKCIGNDCAGPQISEALEALRTGKGDQLKALRILVHLVGDIHQPLHTAENQDGGGNGVILRNRYCINLKGETVPCNLHTYWDNSLVKVAKGQRSERNFVKDLAQMNVSDGGEYNDWIKESNELAKSKVHTYEGFACGVANTKVRVTDDYDKNGAGLVSNQLATAGKRLAAVLNGIYK